MDTSPEHFAEILAQDIGLTREHEVLVAHAIRTKLFAFWEASLQSDDATSNVGAERSRRKSTAAGGNGAASFVRGDEGDKWCPRVEQLAPDLRDVVSPTSAATSKRCGGVFLALKRSLCSVSVLLPVSNRLCTQAAALF